MPPPYCYDYPRPSVTIDLAVFTLAEPGLRVLLIRRQKDPFAGKWALPGGFLDIDEPVEAGARRELREETGLDVAGPVAFLGAFADPGRDPRGRTISLAHAAVVRAPAPKVSGRDDAQAADWLDPRRPLDLAFDHDLILAAALDWLKRGVADGPIGLALLPEEFTDADVAALHRALDLPGRGALPWRKRQWRAGRIAPLGESGDRFHAVS
ncbi:MAG TPA: NUDIX hydrolase [Isosphaeraceae bacterium]|nr:NUDIX hydrolase [Isosphaeraceae bacterium]